MASGEKAADCDYLGRIEIDSTLTRTFEIEICKYMDGQETASPHVRRLEDKYRDEFYFPGLYNVARVSQAVFASL